MGQWWTAEAYTTQANQVIQPTAGTYSVKKKNTIKDMSIWLTRENSQNWDIQSHQGFNNIKHYLNKNYQSLEESNIQNYVSIHINHFTK